MTGPSAKVVQQVRERDGHQCVRCGVGRDLTTHHRIPRGMGGTKDPRINHPSNLLTLCGSGTTGCHGWAESHRLEAVKDGLIVSRYADPTLVPVMTWRGLIDLGEETA